MKPLSHSLCGKKSVSLVNCPHTFLGHGKGPKIRSEVLLLGVCGHIVSGQGDIQGCSSNFGSKICHRVRKKLVATHYILTLGDMSPQTSFRSSRKVRG
jgi:hypothetical protein